MRYEGECPVPGCGRPARDYHGDGEEIICYEHYLYDLAVMRRLHIARQSRYAIRPVLRILPSPSRGPSKGSTQPVLVQESEMEKGAFHEQQ
jgi:hypothetical protein